MHELGVHAANHGRKGKELEMGNYGTYIVTSHEAIGPSTAQEQALTKLLNREEEVSQMIRHGDLGGGGGKGGA